MKVDIISDEGGEWTGVYIDGKLRYANHSVSDYIYELLEKLGAEVDTREDWPGEEYGHLPENLEEAIGQCRGDDEF